MRDRSTLPVILLTTALILGSINFNASAQLDWFDNRLDGKEAQA